MTAPANPSGFSGLNYDPSGDGIASIDKAAGKNQQMNTFFWLKKSLIEARKEQFFMPLSSVIGMPKNFGKTIKVYEYVPLLDDRNINDQGIDASGVVHSTPSYYVQFDKLVYSFAEEANATAAADAVNAIEAGVATKAGAGTPWTVTMSKLKLKGETKAKADAVAAAIPSVTLTRDSGNLYGSSKDIGTITGKLPFVGENGGRVNRVGFTRLEREGTFQKFGFFHEWSKESMDFDSDAELNEHLSRELMNGAVQLTEAVLQKDLLAAAGTTVYAGAATSDDEITGEEVAGPPKIPVSLVTYEDLMRLDQILTDNRTPKQTKVITGSRLVDTKTIPAGRVMFVGSELVPALKAMKDLFGNPAFIAVQHYADAGTVLNGEIGMIDSFHIVQVPEMLHWAGEGAATDASKNPGYRTSVGSDGLEHYDIFPMLVVGDESFVNIGFQTDGKTVKFSVITKMPGNDTADRTDPYGETGFSSIKWFYGILVKRPERIGLIKTIAPV